MPRSIGPTSADPAELFFGSDRDVSPDRQRRRERGLLEAAALAEIHLHVATLSGASLGLGAFHRRLDISMTGDAPSIWRRHTGGRAVAAGDGFAIVSLALPHRAALVGATAADLRPEQVLNRAVRGVLEALRELGIDPVYPGLDLVTVDRRALAHVSFVERADGPTLFQAVIATTEPLARVAELLDRADPDGLVPTTLLAPASCAILADRVPAQIAQEDLIDPARLATRFAAAYARVFGLDACELDPGVVQVLGEEDDGEDDAAAPRMQGDLPDDGPNLGDASRLATAYGRLGPVQAWVQVSEDRVVEAAICGDFIAPDWLPERLRSELIGSAATSAGVTTAVARVIDGDRGYLLGLQPDELVSLLLDAGGIA